eukprot:gene23032-biopygen1990
MPCWVYVLEGHRGFLEHHHHQRYNRG